MRRHADDVQSFSIGFEEEGFDESRYSTLAAGALGTKHHLEVFASARMRDLIPRIAEVLDEPMGDQSIFPTFLLSTITREHVKVALGGDGSDEILMGYRSFLPLVAWSLDRVPPLRDAIAATASVLPNKLAGRAIRGLAFARRLERPPVQRLLSVLGAFRGDARWVMAPSARSSLSVFRVRRAGSALRRTRRESRQRVGRHGARLPPRISPGGHPCQGGSCLDGVLLGGPIPLSGSEASGLRAGASAGAPFARTRGQVPPAHPHARPHSRRDPGPQEGGVWCAARPVAPRSAEEPSFATDWTGICSGHKASSTTTPCDPSSTSTWLEASIADASCGPCCSSSSGTTGGSRTAGRKARARSARDAAQKSRRNGDTALAGFAGR